MMKNPKLSLALAASLMVATASPTVITPTPAYSIGFGEKIKKDFRKVGKKVRKDLGKGGGKRALQVIGLGLTAYGIADGSVAAAIIGVTLVAAPEIFKKDIARTYGKELNWAGCTNCKKRRIIVAPDRKLSKKRRAAINSRTKEDVKDIQGALKDLGYYKKRIDGDFGPGTRAGVKEFQVSLGDQATGILTSEQRHRLFIRAEKTGYTRLASLNQIDEATATTVGSGIGRATVPVVGKEPAPNAKPVIAEFVLAKSQFDKFSEQFLKSGNQTVVTDAALQPDGSMELTVKDLATGGTKKIVGSISGFRLKPHQLADEWARVTYSNGSGDEPAILNTRDDLGSAADTALWIEKGKKSLMLLSKLTGVEMPEESKKPETVLVSNEPSTEQPVTEQPVAERPVKEETADAVVASVEQTPTEQDSADESAAVETAMAGFDAPDADEICRQNLYVSWKFPDGESPINHYNIMTPAGVVMMDNGDSTAYFTGSCVLGQYGFSYVYVQKGKEKKDWKHFKREGSFQIALNAEQCSIDLNNPDGSAAVQCY